MSTPVATNGALPALQPAPPPSAADLQREYVSGGGPVWYGGVARSLPFSIDEITDSFGSDIYERMLAHPQVAAVVNFFRSSIIEDGLTLTAAIDDKADPKYPLAAEIHAEAQRMLDNLRTPLNDVLADQLAALWQGNSLAELEYAPVGAAGSARILLNIVGIKVKPLWAYAFVVDNFLNVLGILALKAGQTTIVYAGTPLNEAQLAEMLPRQKFIILTHRPRNADPRGTSILRAAFSSWNLSQALTDEWRKFLVQFASPTLFGFTPEDAAPVYQRDASGAVVYDAATGEPVTVSAEQQMNDRLTAVRNGTAATFPGGAKVQPMMSVGDGHAFLRAFSRCDQQITKAVLTASLTTEEGEHQTRAATSVHQDATDTLVRQEKHALEWAYYHDALSEWVRLNWGEDAVALTPLPDLGTIEQQDIPAMITALSRAGYKFDQRSQLAEVDSMVGLTPRDLDRPPDLAPPPAPTPFGAPPADPTAPPAPVPAAAQGAAA